MLSKSTIPVEEHLPSAMTEKHWSTGRYKTGMRNDMMSTSLTKYGTNYAPV